MDKTSNKGEREAFGSWLLAVFKDINERVWRDYQKEVFEVTMRYLQSPSRAPPPQPSHEQQPTAPSISHQSPMRVVHQPPLQHIQQAPVQLLPQMQQSTIQKVQQPPLQQTFAVPSQPSPVRWTSQQQQVCKLIVFLLWGWGKSLLLGYFFGNGCDYHGRNDILLQQLIFSLIFS